MVAFCGVITLNYLIFYFMNLIYNALIQECFR